MDVGERMRVHRIGGKYWAWCVRGADGRILPKGTWIARFHTHAEAIAYADNLARTTKNGDNNE